MRCSDRLRLGRWFPSRHALGLLSSILEGFYFGLAAGSLVKTGIDWRLKPPLPDQISLLLRSSAAAALAALLLISTAHRGLLDWFVRTVCPGQPLQSRRRHRFIPAHAGNTYAVLAVYLHCTVHPRACGEHATAAEILSAVTGSSPRMRGTLELLDRVRLLFRFIPAHAGNTRRGSASRTSISVHPRACGEHGYLRPRNGSNNGSSPRMRGTLLRRHAQGAGDRFIPAHAGNTLGTRPRTAHTTVHPRACGEHQNHRQHDPVLTGSSPRMRGTLATTPPSRVMERFIPAHAGNTRHAS